MTHGRHCIDNSTGLPACGEPLGHSPDRRMIAVTLPTDDVERLVMALAASAFRYEAEGAPEQATLDDALSGRLRDAYWQAVR